MSNLMTAHNEYARRPADECYPNLDALIRNAETDRAACREREYTLGSLRAEPQGTGIVLRSERGGAAEFTHWSFGQLGRMIGAPASYLRSITPGLAAQCINEGLQSRKDTPAQMLVRGGETPVLRAVTSDKYARVWDAPLYTQVRDTIARHGEWSLPPTWSGDPRGAYRGDRDSFLILTEGGSIVTDPSLRGGDDGRMYRGILIGNSEVGARAISIEAVYYRFICGNHIIWGAMIDRSFRRRHVGDHAERNTIRAINDLAYRWVNRSAAADQAIIQTLIDREIAKTEDDVIAELRKLGASEEQARAAYRACEQFETASPRSAWGIVQGLTRASQNTTYQGDRLELDRLAAEVMRRNLARVAA